MRTRLLAGYFAFCLLASAWGQGQAPATAQVSAAPATPDAAALQKENAELKARCQALEARLAEFERRTAAPRTSDVSAKASTSGAIVLPKAPNAPPTGRQEFSLDAYLRQLEPYTLRYRNADTSVKKQDLLKEWNDSASEMLKDKSVTLTSKVRDVRMVKDDHATVTLKGWDDTPYFHEKGHPFQIICHNSIVLKMKVEDARMIAPGDAVTITGTPAFRSGPQAFLPRDLLHVIDYCDPSAGGWASGGAIIVKSFSCKIGNRTFTAP